MRFSMITNLHKNQSGFTLLEILIALLVLSIGLLGLAGLQAYGLRNNTSAYHRSQATILAYNILDKMQVNRATARSGNYSTAIGTAPAAIQNCVGLVNCAAPLMATFDLNQWKCSLGNWNANGTCTNMGITGLLPQGDGSIVVAAGGAPTAPAAVTITITWMDEVEKATDTVKPRSIIISSQI